MKCEIMSLNIRFRTLTIKGENYIIDGDRPLLVLFIPFVYWLVPHAVYKVSDNSILEQLKKPLVKEKKVSYINVFGIGITIFLARFLEHISSYFEFETKSLSGITLLLIPLIIIFLLRLYISNVSQKNLKKIIDVSKLEKKKLWMRPQGIHTVLIFMFVYALGLLFTSLMFYLYFNLNDGISVIFGVLFVFLLLFANVLTMTPGTTQVKFQKREN